MITEALYLLSLIGIVVLGLFTFYRRSETSSSFFSFLSLALAVWLGIQFAAIRIQDLTYELTLIGLVAFSFIPFLSMLFAVYYVELSKKQVKRHLITGTALLLSMIFLAFLPGTLTSADVVNGSLVVEVGTGYTLQTIIAVGLILYSFVIFGIRLKSLDPKKRAATKLLSLGLAVAVVGNVLSGLLLANVSEIQFLGPLSILIMVAFITYAVSKHKLFDIRAAVARTVAYTFSLALVVIGFFFISTQLTLRYIENQSAQTIISALLFAFFVIVQQPLKRKADKITSNIFYKDAYDSQEFLDKVNKLLVGQIDLDALLTGITQLIEDNIKTSYCTFVIRETGYEGVRFLGSDKHKFDKEQLDPLRQVAPHAHKKMIIRDELGEYREQLEEPMRKLDISVLIRLVSNTSYDVEGVGYLVLGPKKNGTIFSQQDKQVLDILANEMVIAVENALRFEEIEKFNLTLQGKIDDATKKLRRTNEKLKAMDETKDEFISMASHQLRTPLTSVKGYLSMVLEGDTGDVPEMQRKMLDQAFVSSQRMVYLIADLLNVSRLRTGKFIIEPVNTNLASVVDDEVSQLQETAKARNLTLNYKKPENFPEVPLDETKIRQVVMNFLDNAIYYTPSGGEINVEVKDTGKEIEYRVIDNGIGIPKWEQAHMFTKFYRAGNAKKARPDGTGLGLFMAKKVIVASGGSIIFQSEEGKGSTFGFTFEKAKLDKIAAETDKKQEVTHPKPTETTK